MNSKWQIFKRISFHVGGVILSAWPAFIVASELIECPRMDWRSMCGALLVLLDPPGFLISMPIVYPISGFLDAIGFTENFKSLSYIIGVAIPILGIHYLIGGFIGVWIQKKIHFKTPDLRPRSLLKKIINIWKDGP